MADPKLLFVSLTTTPSFVQTDIPFVATQFTIINDSDADAEFSLDGGVTVHGAVLASETLTFDDIRFSSVDVRDLISGSPTSIRAWASRHVTEPLRNPPDG